MFEMTPIMILLVSAAAISTGFFLKAREIKTLRSQVKELEKKLNACQKQVQETENEFNSIVYSVSHDLRAPLRAVHGFSQIVHRNYTSQINGEGSQFLQIIENNAELMNRMIEDILIYSRLARREMVPMDTDIQPLVEKAAEEIHRADPNRKIQFEIRTMPPARVDIGMIRQVWFQLIHNAVKFSKHRPQALIQIDGYSDQERNVYRIRDNGVGFEMQYTGKLFGLFQRLHSVEEFEGVGSGLAIVKRIVSRHGGKVWFESQPDVGSVFYFSLPRS